VNQREIQMQTDHIRHIIQEGNIKMNAYNIYFKYILNIY
jgi:hypothetical protein